MLPTARIKIRWRWLIIIVPALFWAGHWFIAAEADTGRPANGNTVSQPPKKITVNGITIVYLAGSPYEIGLAHGRLCREEILEVNRPFLETYAQLKEKYYDAWLPLARSLEAYIPSEYIQEMRGIADGAKIDYEKILFLNTLSTLSEKKQCFAFSFRDSQSRLFTLRQIDTGARSELYKQMILYIVKPRKGFGFAALLNPGWVDGETGINEKGLMVSQNNIGIAQTAWNVMPITHLSRQMLQYCATINDAGHFLDSQEAFAARLLFVSNAQGAAIFEIANGEKARIDMQEDYLALANHACSIPSARKRKSSNNRFDFAQRFLAENASRMDLERALDLVRSSTITWRWKIGVHNRQALIFSPGDLDFWIAVPPGATFTPASHAAYIGFNLLNELYGTGQRANPSSFPAYRPPATH